MPDYERLPGSTDVSVVIFIFDPATGLSDSTVVFNTAGLALKHRRDGEANASDYTLVDLVTPALSDPHLDFGLLLIGDGKYRLDLPDAACAVGAPGVQIWGTLTDREIIAPYIHLVANDPFVELKDFDPATDTVNLSAASEGQIDNIETLLNQFLETVAIGTVQTIAGGGLGGADYTLSTNLSTTDGFYQNMFAIPQDGPAAGQPRVISTYTGATRRAQHEGTGTQLTRPFSVELEVGNTIHIKGLVGTL